MPKRIVLMRHGVTVDKLVGKKQRAISKLSEFGARQVEKVVLDYLSLINFDLVVSSPTLRAFETSKIIISKLNKKLILNENLKEINFSSAKMEKILVRFNAVHDHLMSFDNKVILLVSHSSFIKGFVFFLITGFRFNLDDFYSFRTKIFLNYAGFIDLELVGNEKAYKIHGLLNP